MKRILKLVALLAFLIWGQAEAAEVGASFVRTDCTQITNPVVGQTWCFDSTANELKRWNGTAWVGQQLTSPTIQGTVASGSGLTMPDFTSGTITIPTGKKIQVNNLGIEFIESDTNPSCSVGDFWLYADLSENKFKKCQNGTVSDLDTTGGTVTLETAKTAGRTISSAVSQATAVQIGDGTRFFELWCDATDGCVLNQTPAADFTFKIPSGKVFVIKRADNTELEKLTEAGVHTYTGVGRPRKSIYIDADAARVAGNCTLADATIPASGYPRGYVTCADTTGDEITFGWTMPDSWDGGTITVKVVALNVNASPSGTFDLGINGHCFRDGDARVAMNTTNSQTASFTSWAAQNAEEHVTTAAITLNGTCAGGASVDMRARVTAAPAQIADIRVAKFLVEYVVTSRSD